MSTVQTVQDRRMQHVGESEFDMVVVSRDDTTEGVAVVTFAGIDGRNLPLWRPGSHVDLLVPGIGPRQYSLSGFPRARGTWRLGILREPTGRGGSQWLHEHLRPGVTIRARGPRNHFGLVPAKHYLFIAGGIGVTPLLPMVRAIDAAGIPWKFVYLGRSLRHMAFRAELEQYGERVVMWPRDEHPRFDLAAEFAHAERGGAIYSCGPTELMNSVEELGATWGPAAVHVERFAAKEIGADVRNEPFEIELARSGAQLTVPADRSVLTVLLDQGIYVPWSCEEGTCGTCETGVLRGEPEHRDSVLSPTEQAKGDCMMVCVSRACGKKLVLDI